MCQASVNPEYVKSCSLPYFPGREVDAVVWEWVSGFFENEELLEQAISEYLKRQEEDVAPLARELQAIELTMKEQTEALKEQQEILDELKNRKVERTKASILNEIEQIESRLDVLEKRRDEVLGKIALATEGETAIQEAKRRVNQIKEEVKEGLNLAEFGMCQA